MVFSSYWNIETSGQNSSAGGEGKTTAEMKQQATYLHWDFENIWGMRENETYPLLRELDLPVLTMLGNSEVTIDCGTEYNDAGATATDGIDGDLTQQIVVNNNVNTQVPGDYLIHYSVTDSDGHTAEAQRIVHVLDNIPPEISLVGPNPYYAECGLPYVDPGVSATDNCDTDLEIQIQGSVDTSVLGGQFVLTYIAEDDANNTAQVQRTVYIVDTTPPEITLLGSNPMYVECHTAFSDPGYIATDNCDTEVEVEVSGTVNTNMPGEVFT